MKNRYANAVSAQNGACNLTPLTRALADAVKEVLDEGGKPGEDAACRLIAHQLAWLFNTPEFDATSDTYALAMAACREQVDA